MQSLISQHHLVSQYVAPLLSSHPQVLAQMELPCQQRLHCLCLNPVYQVLRCWRLVGYV